jgi:hypothetical protein
MIVALGNPYEDRAKLRVPAAYQAFPTALNFLTPGPSAAAGQPLRQCGG